MKYEQIFIKSENDLPKELKEENGLYKEIPVCKKDGKRDWWIFNPQWDKKLWIDSIDWYLSPLAEVTLPSDEEIRQKISDAFTENSTDANNGQMSVITEDSYSDLIDEIIDIFKSQVQTQRRGELTDEDIANGATDYIEDTYLRGRLTTIKEKCYKAFIAGGKMVRYHTLNAKV